MYLKKPGLDEKQEIIDIINETKNFDGNFEGCKILETMTDYHNWLEKLLLYEDSNTCPKTRVPSLLYLAMEDNKVIGLISIRLYLNDDLKKHGGNIGYFIRPNERGKQKGTKMLSLALEVVKDIGLDKVLITCRNENIASARVMEKNGGVYENDYVDEKTKVIYKRYWINFK